MKRKSTAAAAEIAVRRSRRNDKSPKLNNLFFRVTGKIIDCRTAHPSGKVGEGEKTRRS